MPEAGFSTEDAGDHLTLSAKGRWVTTEAATLDRALRRLRIGPGRAVVLDFAALAGLDTTGAWLIERTRRLLQGSGSTVEIRHLEPDLADLVTRGRSVGRVRPAFPAVCGHRAPGTDRSRHGPRNRSGLCASELHRAGFHRKRKGAGTVAAASLGPAFQSDRACRPRRAAHPGPPFLSDRCGLCLPGSRPAPSLPARRFS